MSSQKPKFAGKDGDLTTTNRRAILGLLGAGAATLATTARAAEVRRSALAPPADPKLVRLSSVVTPQDGGLYGALLPEFTKETGLEVQLTTAEAVYEPARTGHADIVLSHFGHHDLQAFMEDGLGEWPQTAFFNQLALLGPASDPAKIRGQTDLVIAFKRIAASRSAYVVNDTDGIKYLSEFLWEAAGRPSRDGWYFDPQGKGPLALSLAAEKQGYVIWGLTPFLRTQGGGGGAGLTPVVLADPLLRRIMVTVAVRPDKVAGVNTEGVKAFQQYLVTPRTQALIQAFRLPGIDGQVWWPAGRNNSGDILRIGNG